MANFFTDNPDLVFQFERLDLERAVAILEHDYSQADSYEDAPRSYAEALETYRAALELTGDISGNFIAPRSASIDLEGSTFEDGKVGYAKDTLKAYRRLAEAGLTGVIIPRKFGGINFPATIYMMMIEMVSRADASLMTLFGYQDVGEAIAKVGTEAQGMEFLPRYTRGEHIGAMVLTEPGAGSDLQAIRLQAYQDEAGTWRLRGTKHFISNGNGDLLLVLARSEPDAPGMFGLSLFACHGGDRVQVNRVEDKMGLHGSPTCELYFDDAPVELIGKRRFGLFYVINILNHARFSVAAQGLGIAEAAYTEALAYAKQREQFGKLIYTMPPIADLLIDMRVSLDACRSFLYAGSQWLDLRNKLEELIEERKAKKEPVKDLQREFKRASAAVDLLSPLVKYVVTEEANRICYNAQQIHGGTGYIREMTVERCVRDVRITSIYEGTTQVQVGLAVKHVIADALKELIDREEESGASDELSDVAAGLGELRRLLREAIDKTKARDSEPFLRAAARHLTDTYAALYTGYLLLREAEARPDKRPIARRFVRKARSQAQAGLAAIDCGLYDDLDRADQICR